MNNRDGSPKSDYSGFLDFSNAKARDVVDFVRTKMARGESDEMSDGSGRITAFGGNNKMETLRSKVLTYDLYQAVSQE